MLNTINAVVDEYERAKKRTYLPLLSVVGLYLPLLVGLFLLYPWISGRYKSKSSDELRKNHEGNELKKLLPIINSAGKADKNKS